MNILNRSACLIISLASLGAGLLLALAHPLAPLPAAFAFASALALFLWRPALALYALPLLLPLLNFSPWTGWLVVDEFDLLILAAVAAGYFRLPRDGARLAPLLLIMLAGTLLLILRGAYAAGPPELNWFAAYTEPINSLRVGKSLLWVLLLCPVLAIAEQEVSVELAARRFLAACLVGCGAVVAAALWERAFYPGLLEISTPYRTVALFWEMHLGGAALDAYLVLITPFFVWAWRCPLSTRGRLALAGFVPLFVYVVLTTFARGVVAAIAVSLLVLGGLLLVGRRRRAPSALVARLGNGAVLAMIVVEIVLVIGGDSFMNKRLAASGRDFRGRIQHWQQGIAVLKTPTDWVFGIGLGRLPARLTAASDGPALPGAFHAHAVGSAASGMTIDGPTSVLHDYDAGGMFALAQRIELVDGRRYRLAFDVRGAPGMEMLAGVCALHLLYPARCQTLKFSLQADGWEHREGTLRGMPFSFAAWQRAGHGIFLLSLRTPGARVEVTNLVLAADGANLLRNARFLERESAWFPVAHSYFLPWHIDSLYLELLIETGVLGLLAFLAGLAVVVGRLLRALAQGDALAPYFLSSIVGLLALGLVVSVFDMPRVAILFGLLLLCGWRCASVRAQKQG